MKTLRAVGLIAAVLILAGAASAQTTLTSTTLSAAQTSGQKASLTLTPASTTNFVTGNLVVVDDEVEFITGFNSTTGIATVQRGYNGSRLRAHLSGALLYVGVPSAFYNNDISGACTAANEAYLPHVVIPSGNIFTCLSSGQWLRIGTGTLSGMGYPVRAFCTGTVGSAETEFLNYAACSGATTATGRQVVSTTGYIATLYVYSSAVAVGGTNKDVATVLDNGTATALTCTIAATAATCNDLTHSVLVNAGDVLTVSFVTATSDTAANISVGFNKY